MADLLSLALPFVFVFAVAFGAMEVSGVLKDKATGRSNKKIYGLIAVVLAFFAIGTDWVLAMIMQILPIAVVLFIIVFLVSFITKPFESPEGKKRDLTLIIVVIALGFLFLMGQGYEVLSDMLPFMNLSMDPTNFMYFAGGLLILLLLYAVFKMGSGKE